MWLKGESEASGPPKMSGIVSGNGRAMDAHSQWVINLLEFVVSIPK